MNTHVIPPLTRAEAHSRIAPLHPAVTDYTYQERHVAFVRLQDFLDLLLSDE